MLLQILLTTLLQRNNLTTYKIRLVLTNCIYTYLFFEQHIFKL